MSNNLTGIAQKPTFTMAISTPSYQKLINTALQDPTRARQFVAALTSVVVTNPTLQECDYNSILQAAFLGESMKLPPSPQLGYYYLVPFKDNKNNRIVATFILGYKGYIQLAIRSGQYRNFNALPIKEGELINWNPLTEEITVNLIPDEIKRAATHTVGYYATFELVNGFRKSIYWTREKMETHALQYSAGYKAKKGYTFWEKDFDSMALKTMYRHLFSKYGILSVEMKSAIESDGAVISESGTHEFLSANDLDEKLIADTKHNDELPFENEDLPPDEKADNEDLYTGTPFAEAKGGEITMADL